MGKIIGIDLGTTNSVVSVWEVNEASVIINKEGARLTPSVVAFKDNNDKLIGTTALNQIVFNPKKTFNSIKRFIGKRCNEIDDKTRSMVSYDIVGSPEELAKIKLGDKIITPPEISAAVLQYLKESAEIFTGEKITKAVITVPAYFNDSQRQATKDAGAIAGLEVLRIINEPTAAALAYTLGKKAAEKFIVYDLGGGTFDVSIIEVNNDVVEVLSTNGDTKLGGDDFDNEIVNWLIAKFLEKEKIDLRGNPSTFQRIKEASEKAKKELSLATEADISIPFIISNKGEALHLKEKITRLDFEKMIDSYVEKIKSICLSALKDSKLNANQIDEVIMVGGSTRIPVIQKVVKEIFNKKDLNMSINPDEVVSIGAAVQGGVLAGHVNEILLVDVTPLTLAIETVGGESTPLIKRNHPIPCKVKGLFSTATDDQLTVDLHILQGDRPRAKDNRSLGRFQLVGIEKAPRGIPKIEVTYNIDVNGILTVSALDLSNGKEASIKIKYDSGLTKEQIENMKAEAEKYSEEDKTKKKFIDIKNNVDALIYRLKKLQKEHASKIDDENNTKINKILSQADRIETLSTENADKFLIEAENLNYQILNIVYSLNNDEIKTSDAAKNTETAEKTDSVKVEEKEEVYAGVEELLEENDKINDDKMLNDEDKEEEEDIIDNTNEDDTIDEDN